jgi:hypothetical protein
MLMITATLSTLKLSSLLSRKFSILLIMARKILLKQVPKKHQGRKSNSRSYSIQGMTPISLLKLWYEYPIIFLKESWEDQRREARHRRSNGFKYQQFN